MTRWIIRKAWELLEVCSTFQLPTYWIVSVWHRTDSINSIALNSMSNNMLNTLEHVGLTPWGWEECRESAWPWEPFGILLANLNAVTSATSVTRLWLRPMALWKMEDSTWFDIAKVKAMSCIMACKSFAHAREHVRPRTPSPVGLTL